MTVIKQHDPQTDEWYTILIGEQGEQGEQGIDGPVGPPGGGVHVTGVLSGAATPMPSNPSTSDFYILGTPVPTAAPLRSNGTAAQAGDGVVWTGTVWQNTGPVQVPAAPLMVSSVTPPTPPVVGQAWYEPTLGHSALWIGTGWLAETPVNPLVNICCILGAFDMVLDTAAYTSGVWVNRGLAGAALNGTMQNIVVGNDAKGRQCFTFNGTSGAVQFPVGALSVGASESFTVVAVKSQATYLNPRSIVSGRLNDTTGSGWSWSTTSSNGVTNFRISDGVLQSGATTGVTTSVINQPALFIAVRDVAADKVSQTFNDNSWVYGDDVTTGAITNVSNAYIGRFHGGASSFIAMTGWWFGFLRRVLAPDELIVLRDWRIARFAP